MSKPRLSNRTFTSFDGKEIVLYDWKVENPKLQLHIIHGMSEHANRYDHFACWLNTKGIRVVSSDLRGHGKTAGEIENVGFFDDYDGWNNVVKDIKLINEKIRSESSYPLIILGHSMGSLLARSLSIDYPNSADAFIFSATSDHPGLKGIIGKPIANLCSFLLGKRKKSKLLDFLTFSDFNKRISNNKSRKDWLSRDVNIVDNYLNDPYCMQIFSNQFFADLAYGVFEVNKKRNIAKMNCNTPYLLLSGEMDPVSNYGKGINNIAQKFSQAKIKNTTVKLFKEGRHEMLNEINKIDVYNYIYNWLKKNFYD